MKLTPHNTRILNHYHPITSLTLENSSIYLVPGGRFLLVSSRTGIMSLMDLGHNSHVVAKQIASVIFEHPTTEFDVQGTPDNLGNTDLYCSPSHQSHWAIHIGQKFSKSSHYLHQHHLLIFSSLRASFVLSQQGPFLHTAILLILVCIISSPIPLLDGL